MKLRSVKPLLWLLNGVITLGILASVALFVLKSPPPDYARLHAELDKIEESAARAKSGQVVKDTLLKDFEPCWKTSINGVEPVETGDSGGVQPTEANAPGLDTWVQLIAIVGDHAVFEYKKACRDAVAEEDIKAGDTRPVRRGALLPGVQPDALFKSIPGPEKVEIVYGGESHFLEIPTEDLSFAALAAAAQASASASGGPGAKMFTGPTGQMAPTGRVPAEPSNPNATEGYEVRPGQWMIPVDEANRIGENAREILEEAELSSYRDAGGRPGGIRVDRIKEGSLIVQRGIEEGDVIQRINGQAVNSKTELVDWVSQNYEKYKHYRVEIQRRGQRKFLSFTLQGEPR